MKNSSKSTFSKSLICSVALLALTGLTFSSPSFSSFKEEDQESSSQKKSEKANPLIDLISLFRNLTEAEQKDPFPVFFNHKEESVRKNPFVIRLLLESTNVENITEEKINFCLSVAKGGNMNNRLMAAIKLISLGDAYKVQASKNAGIGNDHHAEIKLTKLRDEYYALASNALLFIAKDKQAPSYYRFRAASQFSALHLNFKDKAVEAHCSIAEDEAVDVETRLKCINAITIHNKWQASSALLSIANNTMVDAEQRLSVVSQLLTIDEYRPQGEYILRDWLMGNEGGLRFGAMKLIKDPSVAEVVGVLSSNLYELVAALEAAYNAVTSK